MIVAQNRSRSIYLADSDDLWDPGSSAQCIYNAATITHMRKNSCVTTSGNLNDPITERGELPYLAILLDGTRNLPVPHELSMKLLKYTSHSFPIQVATAAA
jgi:hypothetical protein